MEAEYAHCSKTYYFTPKTPKMPWLNSVTKNKLEYSYEYMRARPRILSSMVKLEMHIVFDLNSSQSI